MKILSVSTATNHLIVALNEDQQVIVEKNERDERNHSEHLDPLIDEILKGNKLTLKDIDRFAVAKVSFVPTPHRCLKLVQRGSLPRCQMLD